MGELKDIPKHWQIKKLGEECKCVTGTTPPKNDIKNYGIDIPFVKPPQLFDKPINDAPEKLSKKGAVLARILPINSVMVTCIGNLGRTAINKIPVAFNQQINAIIPSYNLTGRFLFYQAQSPSFRKQLEGLSAATTVPIVNKGKFETINIAFPPLPEQQTIVAIIEELLSDLENGKQQLKTAQQQLKIYRQSLLKWAFEGKLTNKDVKDGELPEGWKKTTLGTIISISSGNGLTKSKRNDDGEYLVYGGNGVTGKHSEYMFEDEQLIIGRVGVHCGNAYITKPKSWVTDNAFVVSFEEKEVSKNFLMHLIKVLNLNKYSVSTAQPVISQGKLYPIQVPIPPFKEQHRIVDELESKLTVCDKIEETINQGLRQAETLRQSILQKAFEGKLVNNYGAPA